MRRARVTVDESTNCVADDNLFLLWPIDVVSVSCLGYGHRGQTTVSLWLWPNPALKRDGAKARRPLAPRYTP